MNQLLADDHAELSQLLDAALESSDVTERLARIDWFWARLAMHIRAEHLHLFPAVLTALRESDSETPSVGDAETAIKSLRRDHDSFMSDLARTVTALRELPNRGDARSESTDVAIKLEELKGGLALHNANEEEGVYVWIERLLNADEKVRLSAKLQTELKKVPPRFDKRNELDSE